MHIDACYRVPHKVFGLLGEGGYIFFRVTRKHLQLPLRVADQHELLADTYASGLRLVKLVLLH